MLFATLQNLTQFAADNCKQSTFFGFPHWYEYLNVTSSSSATTDGSTVCMVHFVFPHDIPLIALAIVDILLRLGALVAVGFVLSGGIKYVTSQGEPDATSSARATITNALIGLVITVLATAIVSFIGNQLGGS